MSPFKSRTIIIFAYLSFLSPPPKQMNWNTTGMPETLQTTPTLRCRWVYFESQKARKAWGATSRVLGAVYKGCRKKKKKKKKKEEREPGGTTNPLDVELFFFFFFVFLGPRAAYGGSQARSRIRAVAAGLCQNHSNTRSKPHLPPTPQFAETLDPQPTEQGQGSNLRPYGY